MPIQHGQTKCPVCGGTTTVKTVGHLKEIRCDVCGWTQTLMVYPEEDVSLIDKSSAVVNVRIEWANNEARPDEVMLARRTFKAPAEKPLRELLEQAKKSATYDLGMHLLPLAIHL